MWFLITAWIESKAPSLQSTHKTRNQTEIIPLSVNLYESKTKTSSFDDSPFQQHKNQKPYQLKYRIFIDLGQKKKKKKHRK